MSRRSNDSMKDLITLLYTKISSKTAEDTTFKGSLKDLFGDLVDGVGNKTITKFMWAITHKTSIISNPLFKWDDDGIRRLHGGFYSAGEHIIGVKLIPFILIAMKEYKPSKKVSKSKPSLPKRDVPQKSEEAKAAINLSEISTEELATELFKRGWTITFGGII